MEDGGEGEAGVVKLTASHRGHDVTGDTGGQPVSVVQRPCLVVRSCLFFR